MYDIRADENAEYDRGCDEKERQLPRLGVYWKRPSTEYPSDNIEDLRRVIPDNLWLNGKNVDNRESNDLKPVNEVRFLPENPDNEDPEARLKCGGSSLSCYIAWFFQSSTYMLL